MGMLLLELPHRNAGMGEAVGRDPGVDGKSKGEEGMTEAYCFKCRTKQEIEAPQDVTLKNGRPATTGEMPGVREEVVPHGLLVRSQSYPGEAGYIGGWRDRHVRGSGGLAPGNRQPVCTRGSHAAMVSKRGAGTPENGATNPENGLEHFSYTGLRLI